MKYLLVLFCLLFFRPVSRAQEIPKVDFNHLFLVLRNEDLTAIQKSEFIKEKLCAFEVRTTKGSNESWTGSYLHGTDNYIELFDTTTLADSPLGSVGIGFSVDRLSDLDLLKATLSKEFPFETFDQTKDYNGSKISWYHGLFLNDSIFYEQSALGFWIMAYDTAYFNYNKLTYAGDVLTERAYLQKFDEARKGKILKRFTGATLNLTQYEKEYFSKYLINIGFKQSGDSVFKSADGQFQFTLHEKADPNSLTLSVLLFETSSSNRKQSVAISDNVIITLVKKTGQINFR